MDVNEMKSESVALLEEHVLEGIHKGSEEICSMNMVKQIVIDKMICTAQFHHPCFQFC